VNVDQIKKLLAFSVMDFLTEQKKALATNPTCEFKSSVEKVFFKHAKNLGLENQLKPNFFSLVETATHLGVPWETETFQTMLLNSLVLGANFSLSSSAVRVNTSTFPRGIVWNGIKIPLLKNDFEQNGTFFAPKLQKEDLKRAANRLIENSLDYIAEIIMSKADALLRLDDYKSQLVALNNILLKIVAKIDYLTLPLEEVTIGLLISDLNNKGIFWDIFFNKHTQEQVLKTFDGLRGAWKGKLRGTHFLVAKNYKGDLTNVYIENGYLNGRDRDLQIPLDFSSIMENLCKQVIVPSTFTSLTLLLLNRVGLLGGYFQIDYLDKYISGLNKIFNLRIPSSLNCFGYGFAIKPSKFNLFALLSNRGQGFSVDEFLGLAAQTSLKQALLNSLPLLKKDLHQEDAFYKVLDLCMINLELRDATS
jgi:hypothetical protein